MANNPVEKNLYLIVEFPQEKNKEDGSIPTAIISNTWVFKDVNSDNKLSCWWPNFKSDEQRTKAVIQHRELDVENCMLCEITIKYKTDIYQKAVVKLKKLEQYSDIGTDDDKRTTRGVNKNLTDFAILGRISDSSDSMSSPPTPPKKVLKRLVEDKVQDAPQDGMESLPIGSVVTLPWTLPTEACSKCNIIEGLCTHILGIVEKNSKKIDELTQMVNASLLDRQVGEPLPLHANAEIADLPINTVESLNLVNNKLNDKEEYSNMLNVVKFIGGKDVFDTTRRILSRVVSNDLARKVNWVGRNDKPAFKSYTNVLDLILGAVRLNPMAFKATEQEIFAIIKVWLRGAIDRDGGRIKRKRDNIPGDEVIP